MTVRRVYVEKKPGFDVEAATLLQDLKENLHIKALSQVRVLQRYDVEGIPESHYEKAKSIIFSEPTVDKVYDEHFPKTEEEKVLAVEYLPGQYDQRADSAAQCVQIMTQTERPEIRVARIIVMSGSLSSEELDKIKAYVINPVETREASMEKPATLETVYPVAADVAKVEAFINAGDEELADLRSRLGLAMSAEDLAFCRNYFKDEENRNPTLTELRMIDTYWSDHCRHTTFLTELEDVSFQDNPVGQRIKEVYQLYLDTRKSVHGDKKKDITLMDMATLAMKHLRKTGDLNNLDESEEINACSIVVKAEKDEGYEDWLIMFKNETHNHPTEIEPFGGAATCLGGAIRDPLSGRSYVYQAMRVTGSGDPRAPLSETLPGKLPQRVITRTAAHGYSSYGNQIGLATGQVSEIYHPDYVAKRMEIGAVVGAAPKKNVVRKSPEAGDMVVLVGGRTGRDGCGGATGSSKEHTEDSLASCGAEVQKGNAPTERKIQRLFRKTDVCRMIKRCNDFGAGGVSVAIGELADGLEINLDAVPKKYEGLDGTELAISESQERMAVVLAPQDVEKFIKEARLENLEATKVAVVTQEKRLKMRWRGKTIVDISRDFLNTNGARQIASAFVEGADTEANPLLSPLPEVVEKKGDLKEAWTANLKNLNVCSQKGLVERFDGTIGGGSVLMPFGGKTQLTPAEGMAAKLPVETGNMLTGTIMTYGYNPYLSKWSPFHGASYAVLESLARLVAMGGRVKDARLTFQEYFERLGKNPEKWGKPVSALMGAFYAQLALKVAAIGGKDSMSGTFKDLNVPPTLVSFALAPVRVTRVLSPEFKKAGSRLVLLSIKKDTLGLPDFEHTSLTFTAVEELIGKGKVLSAMSVKQGGLAEALSKMAFGNGIGVRVEALDFDRLFVPDYGALVLELPEGEAPSALLEGLNWTYVGETQTEPVIKWGDLTLEVKALAEAWSEPLEKIFPTRVEHASTPDLNADYKSARPRIVRSAPIARPRVFIPVFPGTNCEYDTRRKFEEAGAQAEIFVLNNLTAREIDASIQAMKKKIDESQIVMLPGGFSAGDEPDGSGKFIATVFRNPYLADSIMKLLKVRDGLMLGICNGFQALIKLGLVPYGEIRELDESCPTLTFNTLGRHVSRLVTTRVASNISPWLSKTQVGDIATVAVSHGEGRFVASPEVIESLKAKGQIATQYVDENGLPAMDIAYNPNGSALAIEAITSEDGRILGKMAHDERFTENTFKNVPGRKDQKIFAAGVEYYL